jgi:hypothetical protein
VERFERIRRDYRNEGLSVRALAQRHRVHRRAVRQVLVGAVPPSRKSPERVAPVLVRIWRRSAVGCSRTWRRRGSSVIPRAGSGSG